MATKKGTKMSLADFIQQEGGADPSNALPTAPRQRDPNESNDLRHNRAWKSDRFDGAEGSGERRRYGGGDGDGDRHNRGERRGRRDAEGGPQEGEESGPSKADVSSQWRSNNASSERRPPRHDDRSDRGDRDRSDRSDRTADRERDRDGRSENRERDDKPNRDRESRGPSEADHVSDWRSAGSSGSSGSRAPRYDDRRSDRTRERSDRDRDDRRDFGDRRRDDRDDRDRDSSSSASRWGGRDNRDDRRDDRERDDRRGGGGRFFDRAHRDDRRDDRDFDRDRRSENRFDRRTPEDRGQRDERPAHLRFGKGRSDGPSSSSAGVSNEEFPSLKDRSNRQSESSAASSSSAAAEPADKPKVSAATALERLAKRKADAGSGKEKDHDKDNRNESADTEKDKEEKPEEEKSKKKSKKPVAASPLEAALKGSVFLSDIQFAESVNWLTDEKDRLDDGDQRKEIVVAIALSVIEKKLSLAAVIDSLDNSALSGIAGSLVLDVIKAIQIRRDESVALAVVKSAGQDKVLGFIAGGLEKAKLEAFLAEHDLANLAPVPDLSESVSKALKNGESAESVLKLIESSVERKSNVSYLLPIVLDRFLSLLFADKAKANLAFVKEFSPLLARVSAFDKLAKVSVVGSVVNGWFTETKAARGVLKDVLEALLNGKVVSVEVLTDWKDSKEKGTAKMKALLQIATWVSELVPKHEEPEENEEGEDEEDESDLMANPNQSD